MISVAQTPSVEPWIVVAVVAGLIIVRHFAIRRIANGQRRFVWVYFAPTIFVMTYLIWIPVRMWTDQPAAAIALGLLGIPSLLLFVRMLRRMATDAGTSEMIGDLSPPYFDFIVWTAIGVPMLLVIGLIVLAVSGKLGG